jgi:metal transporter CNNM
MEYFIVIALVMMSAFFSGLTLGFFSLNKDDLKRKASLGDVDARKVYNIRKNGNLLLCTLLIGNVAVNSTLSIFLGSIVSGVVAGFVATGLIVVFGEILPQSIFSRYALLLGARFAWVVRVVIFIFYPVCFPLAYVLDKILSDEMSTVYSKKELIEIIDEHENSDFSDIDRDDERIIKGALSFSDKIVHDVMIPRSKMYFLNAKKKFTKTLIREIYKMGHSRVPVYGDNRDDVVGVLFVKDLIMQDWKEKKIIDVMRSSVVYVRDDDNLDTVLNKFQRTKRIMFVVRNEHKEVCGIITVEDLLEEIIGREIVDEFDGN